jgi:type I restriction enzyme M protein
MNMILHGVDSPNIRSTDTLLENLAEVQEKDRYDVILANPPFGAGVLKQTQQNFAIRTGESAYLFLQHFIKYLKAGGRAAIVIKNTFLSNSDNASVALRQELLEKCNLRTVLDCPGGTFLGAGVKTIVLFFDKGSPTKKIWFYQLNPGRNLGKTDPLNDRDLAEFVEMSATQSESDNSWLVDIADINKDTWDLTINNPSRVEEVDHRTPQEIIAEIEELDAQAAKGLQAIKELL